MDEYGLSKATGLRADVQRLHAAVVELHHCQPHRRRNPWHRPGGCGRDGRGEPTDVHPHRQGAMRHPHAGLRAGDERGTPPAIDLFYLGMHAQ